MAMKLGYAIHFVADMDRAVAFHRALTAAGIRFTRAPTPEHGVTLAEFVDSEGARVSLSG